MKKILVTALDAVVNGTLSVLAAFKLTSPNRIVIALSPIFVSVSGAIAAMVAQHFPGAPHLSSGQVVAVFTVGATLAASKLLVWLNGWKAHELRLVHPTLVNQQPVKPPFKP